MSCEMPPVRLYCDIIKSDKFPARSKPIAAGASKRWLQILFSLVSTYFWYQTFVGIIALQSGVGTFEAIGLRLMVLEYRGVAEVQPEGLSIGLLSQNCRIIQGSNITLATDRKDNISVMEVYFGKHSNYKADGFFISIRAELPIDAEPAKWYMEALVYEDQSKSFSWRTIGASVISFQQNGQAVLYPQLASQPMKLVNHVGSEANQTYKEREFNVFLIPPWQVKL
jgi:hypothetical protein